MKYKTCVTVMLWFSEDGHILPLDVAGKSNQPHCCRLIKYGITPSTYTHQKINGLIETEHICGLWMPFVHII